METIITSLQAQFPTDGSFFPYEVALGSGLGIRIFKAQAYVIRPTWDGTIVQEVEKHHLSVDEVEALTEALRALVGVPPRPHLPLAERLKTYGFSIVPVYSVHGVTSDGMRQYGYRSDRMGAEGQNPFAAASFVELSIPGEDAYEHPIRIRKGLGNKGRGIRYAFVVRPAGGGTQFQVAEYYPHT